MKEPSSLYPSRSSSPPNGSLNESSSRSRGPVRLCGDMKGSFVSSGTYSLNMLVSSFLGRNSMSFGLKRLSFLCTTTHQLTQKLALQNLKLVLEYKIGTLKRIQKWDRYICNWPFVLIGWCFLKKEIWMEISNSLSTLQL